MLSLLWLYLVKDVTSSICFLQGENVILRSRRKIPAPPPSPQAPFCTCSHTHHFGAQLIFHGWPSANTALNCGKSEKCLIAFYIAWFDTNNSWVWMSRQQSCNSQREKNNKINPQRLWVNYLWNAQKNFPIVSLCVSQRALLIKVQDQEVNLSSSRHLFCMHNKLFT